jgi:DNA-binding transcriptional ArsR family regulator
MTKIDADEVRRQIEALLREHPDLNEDEDLLHDMLEGETDLFAALSSLATYVAATDALVASLNGTLSEFRDRKSRFETRVEVLREVMLKLLQTANLKRVELPEATLSQVRRQPQIVGEVDADALPDDLVRIKREPNRTAIREALDNGRELPGLSLSNAAPGLMMKVK